MHADALGTGRRVLIVDDVLATGGTLQAAALLVERSGATIAGAALVLEIVALGGRGRWSPATPLHVLLSCA
jgi:adenine phosphoribosyltransferase